MQIVPHVDSWSNAPLIHLLITVLYVSFACFDFLLPRLILSLFSLLTYSLTYFFL